MLQIEQPFHGAVLNRRNGREVEGGLEIAVTGAVPEGQAVSVNGAPARVRGGRFQAEIVLRQPETDLVVASRGAQGACEHRVRVVWDRHSRPRYRFSIDDNVFFLRDLAAKRPASIFENFYLAFLRDMHTKYGTRFSINLFYTTPEKDFTLDQFPDAWRGEWAENADWLKLTFHSHGEFPDRPYQHAKAEKLARDYDRLAEQAQRFAGEASWVPPTVIHWGMVHPNAMRALVERGVTALSGFFMPDTGGTYTTEEESTVDRPAFRYDVNYWLDNRRSEYLVHHDAWKDFETGIVYSKADIVCNNCPVEKVAPTLEAVVANPDTAEILDLFTHEQYFWPFYHNHRPDHMARCEAAIRFCTERGYKPVLFNEGLLGG